MKIEKLIIYGYGFLQNVELELGSGLHVIHGKNEAGKSTLLSFIETMLFGFASRQKRKLHYAPKSGGVHGGMLAVHLHNYGTLAIERVRGREPEESRIYLNDETLDDKQLHGILQKIDRPLFRQLFATRLEHLREMEKLAEDDLNRFLLGTSLPGQLPLNQIESELEKRKTELYRPQGRKPLINERLAELQQLESKLKKSARLKADYEQKANEKSHLQQKLHELQTEKKQIKSKLQFYEKFRAAAPLFQALERHQLKLAELPPVPSFPEEGIARLEQLNDKIVDLEAQHRALHQRILKLEQAKPSVNHEWLEQSEMIDALRGRNEAYQLKLEQRLQAAEQLKHLEQDVQAFIEQIGFGWTPAKIADADASAAEQAKIEHFAAAIHELTETCKNIEKDLASKQNQLKSMQAKADEFKKKLLSEDEKKQLQAFAAKLDRERREHEAAVLRKLIERYDREQNAMPKSSIAPSLFTFAAGMALACFFFFSKQTGMSFIMMGLTAFTAFFVHRAEQTKRARREQLLQLKKEDSHKLDQLLDEQNNGEYRDLEAVQRKLALDEERRKEWLVLQHQIEQLQVGCDRLANEYEKNQRALRLKNAEAEQWAKRHDFPPTLPPSHWLELFHRLKEAKKQVQMMDRKQTEKIALENWISSYEQDVCDACAVFQLTRNENATTLIMKMSRLLEEEKAKKLERERIENQIADEENRLHALAEKKAHYEEERKQLLQKAQCGTEEEFLARGKAWHEKQTVQKEINAIEREIHACIPDEKEKAAAAALAAKRTVNADDVLLKQEKQLRELENEETKLMQRIAQLQVEMKAIEEGGEYDANLQKLENKKAQLRHEITEWATHAVALHVLKKTKDRFRNERLPQVIARASENFSKMTNGAYRSLSVPADGDAFYVESREGIRFQPNELSRGTQEQLYLSLRLALASAYPSMIRFPLLLDDILVHFDQERRRSALNVLHEYAAERQILLFTCHQHIAAECQGKLLILEEQAAKL